MKSINNQQPARLQGGAAISSAFTMVELLVVISILGILAALALASFTSSQKQARDTQRKSDLKQYATSLESFANKTNSLYPSQTSGAGVYASTILCTSLSMTTCPEDPKFPTDNTFVYRYQSDGSGPPANDATKYVLWAKVENVSVTTYWVICSNGKIGQATSGIPPAGGNCPL